jgi:hypothetical protein
LTKDAAQRIAARLSGKLLAIADRNGIARARDLVALPEITEAAPEPGTAARAMPITPNAPDRAASRAADDEVLRRAGRYVARFERTFSAVIWRERYEQESRGRRRFPSSGTGFSELQQRRVLESELLFIWVPPSATWVAVRDVVAVDGKARPTGERRLPSLLSGPPVSLDQLRRLATENGRFNIGQIVRTFNEPTLALLFLDDWYRDRFSFTRAGAEAVENATAIKYAFVERSRPTVVQDRDRDVFARGSIWIEEATGQILQTVLDLASQRDALQGRMTVRYRADARFDVLVPSEMREAYTAASGEQVTTRATYSDFRRFETAGRLVVPR